jgi:hypothetical protein
MGPIVEARADRAPSEWFADATRWYLQGHQGCAHCRGQHCVFRSEYGTRVEYYCTACDFSACHDRQTNRYFAALGEKEHQSSALLGADALWEARAALGTRAVPGPVQT